MHADATPGTVVDELAPEVRDGYELHRAALRHGLNVLLLPRQVMTASRTGDDMGSELAFVHGVPRTSTLSAVTYAQDKRMRRALLTKAGLPIPKGGSFSVGRGIEDAKRLIARIDYPVVVKPTEGDNTIEVLSGLRDEQQLLEAIEYLRTPTSRRSTYSRSAYALTMLSEPDESNGEVKVPSSYRYLIEKHVPGQYLRFLVARDEVHSVVLCPGGPWSSEEQPRRDITGETHPSLLRMARQAVEAVPGLAVAAVDIVVTDHQRDVAEQDARIVELSERPWLDVQAGISDSLSQQLGEILLRQHADDVSVALDSPRDEIAVDLHIEGMATPDAALSAFAETGRKFGLLGHVQVTDPVEGHADGVLQGDPGRIAKLTELLLGGRLEGHRAMLAVEQHRALGDLETLSVHT